MYAVTKMPNFVWARKACKDINGINAISSRYHHKIYKLESIHSNGKGHKMYSATHYFDGAIMISKCTAIAYECSKWKSGKPSSCRAEASVITSRAGREICCLAWSFAFVLGNESPLRGGHAGPLPILLRFNYPACFQRGNEVGVTAGAKRQPVTAALPLGLSFP